VPTRKTVDLRARAEHTLLIGLLYSAGTFGYFTEHLSLSDFTTPEKRFLYELVLKIEDHLPLNALPLISQPEMTAAVSELRERYPDLNDEYLGSVLFPREQVSPPTTDDMELALYSLAPHKASEIVRGALLRGVDYEVVKERLGELEKSLE